MLTYLVTIGLVLALMLVWVAVQAAYARFARRHPDLGPFRSEGGGCGSCSGGGCGHGHATDAAAPGQSCSGRQH